MGIEVVEIGKRGEDNGVACSLGGAIRGLATLPGVILVLTRRVEGTTEIPKRSMLTR